MHKSYFTIDGFDGIFEGYTDGTHWNGWAKPWFTKKVAMDILRCNNVVNGEDYPMTYDQIKDEFKRPYDDEDFEIFKGYDIDGIHLYDIGTCCWIWDDLADYQSEQSKYLLKYLLEEYKHLDCVKLYDVYYGILQELDSDYTNNEVKIFADGFMAAYK